MKTKFSNLRLCRKISKNENQVQRLDLKILRRPQSGNLSLYKKISKNENQVQRLDLKF